MSTVATTPGIRTRRPQNQTLDYRAGYADGLEQGERLGRAVDRFWFFAVGVVVGAALLFLRFHP